MNFSCVTPGFECWDGGREIARHRHELAYASLVLAGAYEEAGDAGRQRVCAGDVLVHQPFDAHLDRFSAAGAEILNLPLAGWRVRSLLGHCPDSDAVARTAERDPAEAVKLLFALILPRETTVQDWPDILARNITDDPYLNLGKWARGAGMANATVSRGFRRVFGLSPVAFRLQSRARRAWREAVEGQDALAAVAANAGFADQAHMTRSVGALTGRTPRQWRAPWSNGFKT